MQNYQKVVARLLLASHAVMYHPVKYRSLSAVSYTHLTLPTIA